MSILNPQAVKAATWPRKMLICKQCGEISRLGTHGGKCPVDGERFRDHNRVEVDLAPIAHIRAQVFGELMEWCESKSEEIATFETLLAYAEAEGVALVAHHCRELAAKEEER